MMAEPQAAGTATTFVLVTGPGSICSLATDERSFQSGHATGSVGFSHPGSRWSSCKKRAWRQYLRREPRTPIVMTAVDPCRARHDPNSQRQNGVCSNVLPARVSYLSQFGPACPPRVAFNLRIRPPLPGLSRESECDAAGPDNRARHAG